MERVRRNGTNMLENLEMACLMEMEHIFPMMEAGMMNYFILIMMVCCLVFTIFKLHWRIFCWPEAWQRCNVLHKWRIQTGNLEQQ